MTTERERDERRVYLASVINDTDEFNQELIEQELAHPADVGAGIRTGTTGSSTAQERKDRNHG